MASTLSQWGITWTFAEEIYEYDNPSAINNPSIDDIYSYGQFVNGDYWIIGPVSIIAIDPISVEYDPNPSIDISDRITNGSMIDPNGDNNNSGNETNTHGFDSLASGFDSALNVGRPGGASLTSLNPLVIQSGSSLVSSKSFVDDKGSSAQLEDFAVLTILSTPPSTNSFRPDYASTDKTIKYNLTDINFDTLKNLTIAGSSAPSLSDVTNWFKYPTISIAHSTRSAEIGGNRYSQHDDYTERLGQSLLLLNCNFTDAEKQTPLINILQNGIDRYGVLTNGGAKIWRSNGAWHMGIKLTIMATAKLLGDDAMLSDITNKSGDYWESGEYGRQTWPATTVPPDYYYFTEDGDTFIISSWDIGTAPFLLTSWGGSYDYADRYQTTGTVNVVNGSYIITGIGTTWLDMDQTDNPSAPELWFGVDNDKQAYSRTGSVYDVDIVLSDTKIKLVTRYDGVTNLTGTLTYKVGRAIAYGHKSSPNSWNGYRGNDLNEPALEILGLPDWQDYYISSKNAAGINPDQINHGYRGNCGRNYGSQALPVLIMGLKPAWNHDVFFDYTDRYIAWARDTAGWANSAFQDQFTEDMWDAYRTDYAPEHLIAQNRRKLFVNDTVYLEDNNWFKTGISIGELITIIVGSETYIITVIEDSDNPSDAQGKFVWGLGAGEEEYTFLSTDDSAGAGESVTNYLPLNPSYDYPNPSDIVNSYTVTWEGYSDSQHFFSIDIYFGELVDEYIAINLETDLWETTFGDSSSSSSSESSSSSSESSSSSSSESSSSSSSSESSSSSSKSSSSSSSESSSISSSSESSSSSSESSSSSSSSSESSRSSSLESSSSSSRKKVKVKIKRKDEPPTAINIKTRVSTPQNVNIKRKWIALSYPINIKTRKLTPGIVNVRRKGTRLSYPINVKSKSVED